LPSCINCGDIVDCGDVIRIDHCRSPKPYAMKAVTTTSEGGNETLRPRPAGWQRSGQVEPDHLGPQMVLGRRKGSMGDGGRLLAQGQLSQRFGGLVPVRIKSGPF
jgi:hypothetical protein